MAFQYDPEIGVAVQAMLAMADPLPPLPRGDAGALRRATNEKMAMLTASTPLLPDAVRTMYRTTANDGSAIDLHWFSKAESSSPGSAVLYIHGGGMICGSVDLYRPVIEAYVAASGVPMLAVAYRLAPEHPHPVPVEDAFAGLRWLVDHAAELGVDPARVAVMGDSAGGGIAAGVALLARDRNLALAKQVLIYPMLDDRNLVPDEALVPFANWTYDDNFAGWNALLGSRLGSDEVPATAAPARATNLEGVAAAYIEVGELDIFRDECIDYARRVAAAGISSELHVYAGAPHGFERMAPNSSVAQRAVTDRIRVLKAL
jgi:acetyl esterase/lipase